LDFFIFVDINSIERCSC